MRISDWSSDVCSSDLILFVDFPPGRPRIVDYEAKWAPESDAYANTPRRFDLAADDAALAAELSRLALDAWHLFGLAGYARFASTFDHGMATSLLAAGELPGTTRVEDPTGLASGALLYRVELAPGESREVDLLAPLIGDMPRSAEHTSELQSLM